MPSGTYSCSRCLDKGYLEWAHPDRPNTRTRCGNCNNQAAQDANSVPAIMEAAAATFRSRNAQYKDNKDNVGGVMMALFPEGMVLKTKEDFIKWHLFELMIVKMTRYANSGLTHKDSIHDLGIYAFMVEKETQ